MVMSQGTYTFLACFAGFWLVWALVVMLCCFCSFLQRKLKRRREERLREQCMRALEMEPLDGYPPPPPLQLSLPLPPARDAPQFSPQDAPAPRAAPQGGWADPQDPDVFGKPPCYEEAVLMEDPPPPYSEVSAEPRVATTYAKPSARCSREHQEPETSKTAPVSVFPGRGYSSLIRLPSARRWDSLGHLLSSMELNHHNLPAEPQAAAIATMPRERRTHTDLGLHSLRGLEQGCGLPTAYPLLGRSTAV
ncbi:proline-rich protein 7 [Denticeps clupeoides]|uniref:Proline-rich protein 7 n=1 Tax=Denticeps clupeoides TaxID=299321 RepID=A0AAY4EG63_9TELE|nr:proline-rich protein 7 [Denticeps clupeoides]